MRAILTIRPGFKIKTIEGNNEVGYVTTTPFDANGCQVYWLFINEEERRKGYAAQALMTLEGIIKAKSSYELLFIAAGEDNAVMHALLRKLGYEEHSKDDDQKMISYTKPIMR
jgi:hypothetical protein